jgi:inorganic pyrophosphatase
MRSFLLLVCGLVVGLAIGWLAPRDHPVSSPVAHPVTALASGPVPPAAGLTQLDPLTLRGERSLYDGYPATNPDGTVNAVVEIPAGTNAKWEVTSDGLMTLEIRDGAPRVVNYLPYPGNYGMIPSTRLSVEQAGDGDALDVLVLGPTLPRGAVVAVRLIGVMRFLDKGEQDDKLLAVMDDTPLADVRSLADLARAAPGAAEILHLWFTSYKGPGKMEFQGWGETADALALLELGMAATADSAGAPQ